MVFVLVVLSFMVFFLMFFSLPWCYSSPLVPFLVNRPPPCLCCVANGFFPSVLKPSSVFLYVLEPPLVLLLSFGATSSELNPLLFLFVVLLMVFFLVVLNFLVLFLVFSMSFGVAPHPWYYFWWIKPPFLFCCVVDGFLIGGLEFLSAFDGVVPFPCVAFGESNSPLCYCVGDGLHLMVFT